jgi:periodic tryptophan protein 2
MQVLLLYSNKSRTFPFENRKNIARIALSPDANILISVDEGQAVVQGFLEVIAKDSLNVDGRALLVNFRRGTVLSHFNFKAPVRDLRFSPDGR